MHLLFSYGTLQEEAVQRSTFGRPLDGRPDELVGFFQTVLTVDDPGFVASSGRADHAVARYDGSQDSRVPGMVFDVTEAELAMADEYEPTGYARILATLASGGQAWVYVDASTAPTGPAPPVSR